MIDQARDARDYERVKNAVAVLREHFDSVQVMVTRHAGASGTTRMSHGEGNYYARIASVQDWLNRENAMNRAQLRALEEKYLDEGGGG